MCCSVRKGKAEGSRGRLALTSSVTFASFDDSQKPSWTHVTQVEVLGSPYVDLRCFSTAFDFRCRGRGHSR